MAGGAALLNHSAVFISDGKKKKSSGRIQELQ